MAILYDVPAGSSAKIDGIAEVRVHGSSEASSFRVEDTAALVIEYLAPTTAELPDPITIDVGGYGFASTSVVVFGDVEMRTVYVSAELLRATLSAPVAASYEVKVRNGAVDSNVLLFEFTDPV